jgi:hypothetical protein
MKGHLAKIKSASVYRLALLAAVLCAFAAAPLLSKAQPQAATIRVVNNSGFEIHYLYLSPPDSDNWGPDQLNSSVLSPGQSFTINNVSCSGSQIKVVSEDADGCFLSGIVACSADAVWTISQNATPDCGN